MKELFFWFIKYVGFEVEVLELFWWVRGLVKDLFLNSCKNENYFVISFDCYIYFLFEELSWVNWIFGVWIDLFGFIK